MGHREFTYTAAAEPVTEEFLRELKKAVIRTLGKRGLLTDEQVRHCIELIERGDRNG